MRTCLRRKQCSHKLRPERWTLLRTIKLARNLYVEAAGVRSGLSGSLHFKLDLHPPGLSTGLRRRHRDSHRYLARAGRFEVKFFDMAADEGPTVPQFSDTIDGFNLGRS